MEATSKTPCTEQARTWKYSCVKCMCPNNWTAFTSATGPQCCNTLSGTKGPNGEKAYCPVNNLDPTKLGGSPCCPDNYERDGGRCSYKSMPCWKMAQCTNPKMPNSFSSTKGIFCCDNENVKKGQYCNGGKSCKPKYTRHYSYVGQPDCDDV